MSSINRNGPGLDDDNKTSRFEALALPHLDAAYNLARWLTRRPQDADDLVQMAYVRAFRFFDTYRGGDARAWLMTIVRNTWFTTLRDGRHEKDDVGFDETLHGQSTLDAAAAPVGYAGGSDPQAVLESRDARLAVNGALARLPQPFREVVVLKEIDELSYKEIAELVDIPIGTVMSRLARGRKLLAADLHAHMAGDEYGL